MTFGSETPCTHPAHFVASWLQKNFWPHCPHACSQVKRGRGKARRPLSAYRGLDSLCMRGRCPVT
eukprot:283375-Amphidinium_carterae.1